MLGDSDERTPLLQEQFPGQFPVSYEQSETNLGDTYKQFCLLVGNDPADQPPSSISNPPKETLYYRALQQRKKQAFIYALTRALTNTLLLAQIVLGAALTGLGAANSPGWLITIFGAANTVIAGLVAFLKSRGQPMRARMFRDDLVGIERDVKVTLALLTSPCSRRIESWMRLKILQRCGEGSLRGLTATTR